MKKPGLWCLLAVAGMLTVFLLAFQLRRGGNKAPITVSGLETVDAGAENSQEKPEKLNINTATREQLQTLPEIGPVLADRIVAFRQENGAFQTVSELSLVKGIGIAVLDQIMDVVTVGE